MKKKQKPSKPKPPSDGKAGHMGKGPEPERLKIEQDWESAVDHALKVKRPKEGWPK